MQGQLEIYGLQYMRVITAGILFQVLGVGLVPLIPHMGKSLQAMAAMIAGFLTNIVLDYLLVWILPVWSAGRGGGHGAGAGGDGALVRRGLVSCPENLKSPMG